MSSIEAFAVRLLSREQSGNASGATSSKGPDNAPGESSMALSNTDGDVANEGVSLDLKNYCLQTLQNQQSIGAALKESIINANCKSKTKSSWKPSCSRTSTLMKPTASQLAKQNQERLMDNFRFQKSGNNSSVVESQAAKRQKLEGGHLCKVTDTNQQANFVHKAPKREGNVDGNLGHGRLRITVPRPPDLATAQRAQRIRQKDNGGNEHVATRAHGFRARPLNRKIFEAPSFLHQKRSVPQLPEFQEFHLKTTERAVQNTAAGPSTSSCCNINSKTPQKPTFAFGVESSSRGSKRPHVTGAPKQEDCETIHRFKALPLNKKIFSSKGDLGVFRSNKRETTVAMVFNFQTEKRAHHAPPVDLFNKLSLASESGCQSHKPRLSRAPSIFSKVGFKRKQSTKFGSKQIHFDSRKVTTEGIPSSIISRDLGICYNDQNVESINGRLNHESEYDGIYFRRSWIYQILSSTPYDLKLVNKMPTKSKIVQLPNGLILLSLTMIKNICLTKKKLTLHLTICICCNICIEIVSEDRVGVAQERGQLQHDLLKGWN
ncbi:putative TPX2 central domain-containing protein [Helianthus annuus]|nr:putative TPX2 central domain-containing protein [Helianthus annuus]